MRALVTGASSGIGLHIADELLSRGFDVLAVSRTEGGLPLLRKKYPQRQVDFLSCDLSRKEECFRLLKETERMDIDVFVSNAGFGDIGYIEKTSLDKEIDMVALNDTATLILGKSFLLRFLAKDRGRILFVSSAAAFGPAPYMSLYYATKAFVYYLAHGYYRELKNRRSPVTVSVLCPGPVRTGFEKRANARFTMRPMEAEKVAHIAVHGMMKGHLEIVPGLSMKLVHFLSHLVPKRLISKILDKSAEIAE